MCDLKLRFCNAVWAKLNAKMIKDALKSKNLVKFENFF
jgi:hypothetical protein